MENIESEELNITSKPKEINVASSEPYPKITVNEPNIRYAQIISQNFASPKSEFTTITQYIYQNLILSQPYMQIAKTLERIAIVEMHHLNIFGQLITLLGGSPKYQAIYPNGYRIWNGAYVNYSTNINQILYNNALAEQKAYDTYISQAEYIKDENICAILERIAKDEKIHIDIFNTYIAQL